MSLKGILKADFYNKILSGATLQIEKYTAKWGAYAPQTWINEYADKRKNITVDKM